MVTRTLTRSLAFLVSFSEIQKKCSESSLAELILLKTYLIVSWSWTIILDVWCQKHSINAFFPTLSAFGLMGGRHRSARSARHHHHSPYHHPAHQHHHAASNALVNPVFRDPFAGFGMSPFGLLGGPLMGFGGGPHRSIFDEFDDGMQMHHPGMQMHPAAVGGGFTSVQTFSGSMGGLNGGVGMRSSSTSTRFVNGKKITTKRYTIRFFA